MAKDTFQITFDPASGNTTAHVSDQRASFIISIPEMNHVPGAMEFHAVIPAFIEAAEQAGKRFLGDERNERMFKVFQNSIARPLKGYLEGATKLRVEILAEYAKWEAVDPASNYDESLSRIEIRRILRESDTATAAKIIADADWRTLAAIVSAGSIEVGLNTELLNLAKERYRILEVTRRLGLAANHKNVPTLEKLIATGFDHGPVEKEARAVLKNRAEKLESVELAQSTIRRIISFCGLLTGNSDAEILTELVA